MVEKLCFSCSVSLGEDKICPSCNMPESLESYGFSIKPSEPSGYHCFMTIYLTGAAR